jgi:hypothetical protein
MKYPVWEEPFEAALQETDPQKLTELVPEAEAAIFARILALDTNPSDHEEQKALKDACGRLLDVKTKILKWPDPFGRSGK